MSAFGCKTDIGECPPMTQSAMSPSDPVHTSGMSGPGNPEILAIQGDFKFTRLN
jgi:hypothetical protein